MELHILSYFRWYVTDTAGKILESGYGSVPKDVLQKHSSAAGIKLVQQGQVQGSKVARWEVKDGNGKVIASGEGQPGPDVFNVSVLRSISKF